MGIAYVPQTMGGLEPRSRGRGRKLPSRAALLAVLITLASCGSTPDASPDQRPPRSGILHLDTAVDLVQGASRPERLQIYTLTADALVGAGRLDQAMELLSYAQRLLPQLEDEIARIEREAQLVAVWQAVAARDQTRSEQVETLTTEVLRRAERSEDVALRARVFLTLFRAELGNPNAPELTLRRTLDLAYLIANDAVRAEALVEAGEYLADADDRVALNPLVQQAIATVPALEAPLLASDLDARLAALSRTLGREADVNLLAERVQTRAAAGLLIQGGEESRLRRIIRRLGAVDRLDLVPGILANIAPQRVRAEAYGWYADELFTRARSEDGEAAFSEGFLIAGMVTDEVAAAGVRARMIRRRSERTPSWDASSRIAELLASVRLAGFPTREREALITEVSIAYILSGRPELTERLRGLIRTADEFSRIMISIGSELAALGREDAASDYLARVTTMPPPTIDARQPPAVTAADAWRRLGEYDRSLVVILDEEPLVVARHLARIPAEHVINPATRGRLLQLNSED